MSACLRALIRISGCNVASNPPAARLLSVDRRHVGLVVTGTGGGSESVQSLKLAAGQFERVGRDVLLDAGDASGAGDGRDVVTAGQDPCKRGLCGCCADL